MSDYVSASSLTGASHIDSDQEMPVEETESPRRKTPRIVARLFEAVLVLRDFFLLLIGLLLDERVDRKVKIFVGSVIAYIISPIDFIPDLLGGLFGLADDFVGSGPDGRVLGKVEYIDTIQRDTSIEKWEFEDLQLTLRGERATLSGKLRYVMADGEQLQNFTDRFVWRDGRWQCVSAHVTRL